MTEELNNSEEQAKDSDKNWKEMREKLESYEGKIAEFEANEGDMTVDGIQAYASEEFGVEFGQQDRLQEAVQSTEQSQERLNNIQANSVVDTYDTDVVGQIREIEKSGKVRDSIAAKLSVIEEAKKNSK